MKKIVSLILVFFVFLSFISATSALDLFPLYTTEQKASLISGEMIKGTSVSDDIMTFVPAGSIITDTAKEVLSYEKGFVVAVDMLIPYPESMKDMSEDEMLLYLYNNSLQVSTMKGIEYISHRAGDKLKVLFDDAYMLLSDDKDDKIDFAAGGVNTLTVGLNNTTRIINGTSLAAAIGAGACVLLFQWGIVNGNYPYMYTQSMKTFFRRGTERRRGDKYPNSHLGYGIINFYKIFNNMT